MKANRRNEAAEAYRVGAARHQAGALAEAETAYRQALGLWPDFPECLAMLGVLAQQAGRGEEALRLLRRATMLEPAEAQFHEYLGGVLRMLGRPAEATAAFAKALHFNRTRPETFRELGLALADLKQWDRAVEALQAALEVNPLYVEAAVDLGNLLIQLDRPEEAARVFETAIALEPENYNLRNDLGLAFRALDRADAAIACFREALRIRPDYVHAWFNLGSLLQEQECWPEALECLERGLALVPQSAYGYQLLSTALIHQRRFEEARAVIERGLQVAPESSGLRFNSGFIALIREDYAAGWASMAASRRLDDPSTIPGSRSKARTWDGARSLSGKTILLRAEQGFGDTIQFVRFAPLLEAQGARVMLLVQPPLVSLLSGMDGIAACVGFGDKLPWHDLQYPLMNLPHALGIDERLLSPRSPYLAAQPQAVAAWQGWLSTLPGRKVGLVWASDTRPDQHESFRLDRRRRSMGLAQLAPLAGLDHLSFVSLQKGSSAAEVGAETPGFTLHDRTAELDSFADTAALVQGLDLVISVDTAVAHLAGALGRPVWVLLPFDSSWRWPEGRDDSPWYPTLRIFRQRRRGDWDEVLARVRAALESAAVPCQPA